MHTVYKFSQSPHSGDECPNCNGEGLIKEQKTFEVVLDQGAPDEHKVVLRGEAGCNEPGIEPGDLIFVFNQVCSLTDRCIFFLEGVSERLIGGGAAFGCALPCTLNLQGSCKHNSSC